MIGQVRAGSSDRGFPELGGPWTGRGRCCVDACVVLPDTVLASSVGEHVEAAGTHGVDDVSRNMPPMGDMFTTWHGSPRASIRGRKGRTQLAAP